MELTFESAFSTGGMVGHLSYILLIISMLMRKINYLRVFVIASALTAICYDWLWLRDPVGVFWETILLVVSLIMLGLEYFQNMRAKFSDEEKNFLHTLLPDLEPSSARKLLNAGSWVNEEVGVNLAYQEVPIDHLYYISEGLVDIHKDGEKITTCGAGNFIGEMSVLGSENAIATVTVAKDARLWTIRKSVLKNIVDLNSDVASALEKSFSKNFRIKFENANQALLNKNMK